LFSMHSMNSVTRGFCTVRHHSYSHTHSCAHLLQALSIAIQPRNAPTSLKLLGQLMDDVWAVAGGDKSTDYNYYTKRGLLAGYVPLSVCATSITFNLYHVFPLICVHSNTCVLRHRSVGVVYGVQLAAVLAMLHHLMTIHDLWDERTPCPSLCASLFPVGCSLSRVGQNRTYYIHDIRYTIYGVCTVFFAGNSLNTVMCGKNERFWPTLYLRLHLMTLSGCI